MKEQLHSSAFTGIELQQLLDVDALTHLPNRAGLVTRLEACLATAAKNGSNGVCLFPEEAGNVEELLRNADLAMYKVKHGGCNHWRFGTRALSRHAQAALDLEVGMRQALKQQESQKASWFEMPMRRSRCCVSCNSSASPSRSMTSAPATLP